MSPWKIYKDSNGKHCVHKENSDGSMGAVVSGGCHESRSDAVDQMRALYASESKEIALETLTLLKEISEDSEDNKPERAAAVLDEWKSRMDAVPSDEDLEKDWDSPVQYVPWGIVSFSELDNQREARDKAAELSEIINDYQGLVGNIIGYSSYPPEEFDRVKALDNLYKEFRQRITDNMSGSDNEDKEAEPQVEETTLGEEPAPDEEKARADVTPADKKRAVAEYGNVKYADEENKKYPIDTEAHIRAAWSYINMPKNAAKYPSSKVSSIKSKITSAWKNKIDKNGPPSAKKKDLLERLKEIGESVKSWFSDEPENETGLSIWKEGNQYWWMARYSNKFRDNDRPREIIASDSHKRFVSLVKEGKAPMPELWPWHMKNMRVGVAHDVAYDDVGFAVAIGTFDVGREDVAEALMKSKESIKVSHGMPYGSIKRDENDSTVIIEHETREISFLPAWAAANQLTGFVVLNSESKEDSMAIPDETKKEWISKLGINPETLKSLEAANAADASKAKEEGLDSKENEEAQPAASETETPPATEPKAETVTLTVEELKNSVTEAVTNIVSPMIERMNTLEASMKELKEIDQKREEILKGTPSASISALIGQFANSAIGADETRVDGRTTLAQSKPKETAAQVVGRTNIPFIDELLAGNNH